MDLQYLRWESRQAGRLHLVSTLSPGGNPNLQHPSTELPQLLESCLSRKPEVLLRLSFLGDGLYMLD